MRSIQQRRADVLAALERNRDLWLATVSRSGRPHRFFRLAPSRIQAYRGYGELEGRDVLNDGRWLA